MPALTPYTDEQIAAMGIEELGVEDGSSPTVNFDLNGSTATREFLCNWTERYNFCRYMCGDASTYFDSGIMKISRILPQTMPNPAAPDDGGDWPLFYAVKPVEVTGHAWRDFDPGAPAYERDTTFPDMGADPREYVYTAATINKFLCAKVKIQYQTLPFKIFDDQHTASEFERFAQFIPEGSEAQYVTRPASTQNYLDPTNAGAGHNVAVPFPVGLTETIYRYTIRLHRWPFDAWGPGSVLHTRVFGDGTDANPPWLNTLNDSSFWEGSYARGTSMLEKVTDQLDLSLLSTQGKYYWQIDLHFAVMPYGWNTSWYFANSLGWADAANKAKRMLVGMGTSYPAGLNPPDGFSNYNSRDHTQLANPGTF
jgi:hypothetical protein